MKTHNRKKQTRFRIPWSIFLALLIPGLLGMVIGSFCDYNLDALVFNPDMEWAQFFAVYGPFPAYAALSVSGGLLWEVEYRKINRPKVGHGEARRDEPASFLRLLLGFILLALSLMLFGQEQVKAGTPIVLSAIFALIFNGCITYGTILALRKVSSKTLEKCAFFFMLAAAVPLGLSTILKMIWGRPRFRVLLVDPSIPFQNWWQIGSSAAAKSSVWYQTDPDLFKSFPSSHTVTAAISFAWCILPLVDRRRARYGVLIVSTAFFWTFITAFSRLVLGAHFLTDVSAGYLLSLSTITLLAWLVFHRYREPDDKALQIQKAEENGSRAEASEMPYDVIVETEYDEAEADEDDEDDEEDGLEPDSGIEIRPARKDSDAGL